MTESIPLFQVCAWPGCDRTEIFSRGLCQRCGMRARRAGNLKDFSAPPKTCDHCGLVFDDGTKSGMRFCSYGCAASFRKEAKRRKLAAKVKGRMCELCQSPVPVTAHVMARYCSTTCQQAAWYESRVDELVIRAQRWKAAHRDQARDSNHRRRVRLRGGEVERIDAQSLWLRDGGLCWICEEPIDRSLQFPDRRCFSMDHVIPVIAGGSHTWDNVASAHLRCNISKKAKVLDRLPAALEALKAVV